MCWSLDWNICNRQPDLPRPRLWNPSDNHSTIILRDSRGTSIGPPFCRETLVCWTADVFSSRLGWESRKSFGSESCSQTNIFEILLNQPEVRLYLLFSDWFGSKWTSVWIQINRKILNTIWLQVDLIRFRKNFSVCAFQFWFQSCK